MSILINPFSSNPRTGDAWFHAGLVSSYPNIDDAGRVGERRQCLDQFVPGCRIFHVPPEDSSKATEVAVDDWRDQDHGDPKNQVMVFQYKARFVAINHVSALMNAACSSMPHNV